MHHTILARGHSTSLWVLIKRSSYLEPRKRVKMKLFDKMISLIKVFNYFCKKNPS